MPLSKILFLALSLIAQSGCFQPTDASEASSPQAADFYDALLPRLQSMDVGNRESAARAFAVTFSLRSQSAFIRYWTAEVPASASSPALSLDYREGIPAAGAHGSFFVISISNPSHTFASIRQRYPD